MRSCPYVFTRHAKQKALDELCEEESVEILGESTWQSLKKIAPLMTIPPALAGTVSAFSGLESLQMNTVAFATAYSIVGLCNLGIKTFQKINNVTNPYGLKAELKKEYENVNDDPVPISLDRLCNKTAYPAILSLGLGFMLRDTTLFNKISLDAALVCGITYGLVDYVTGYMGELKMKNKVNLRAEKIKEDIMKEQKARDEREKAEREKQRKEWEKEEKAYRDYFRNFEARFKQGYFRGSYSEQGQQRPARRSNKLSNDEAFNKLGIRRDSGYDAAKSAFRKLAMQYHPDRNKGNKQAEAKFKEIAAAWEIVNSYYGN